MVWKGKPASVTTGSRDRTFMCGNNNNNNNNNNKSRADALCHRSFFSCNDNTLNVCVNQQQQQQTSTALLYFQVKNGVLLLLLFSSH